MQPSATLEGAIAAFREQELRLIGDLLATLGGIAEGESEDRRRLEEVARDLREMFYLIVVIGEFNAGKSSFVNALLNDPLLPTGITPTTELIEVVRYSETAQRVPTLQEGSVRVWSHPNTLVPGVALVDTPGTGSVFKKHEDTAKSFLHRADLVLFVLSAKRALAETERLYLDLARSYGKKIVLVINQVDLLSPHERGEVKRFVERQVEDLLGLRPLIFLVSAREALAGDEAGSGLTALRAHLRAALAETPPARQKLLAQLDFIERVARNNLERVKSRGGLVDINSLHVRDIERELGEQTDQMNQPLAAARREISTALDAMQRRGHTFLAENLSLRRVGRGVNKDKLKEEFDTTVVGRALKDVHSASLAYVNALVDGSRAYWRSVIDRLNQLHELLGQEIEGLDAGAYAEQREALQDAARTAEEELRHYTSGRALDELESVLSLESNRFALSSGAALSGVIMSVLAVAAQGAVAASPVASLALVIGAPVALIGGAAAIAFARRINSRTRGEFDRQVAQVRATYDEALDGLTRKERARLQQYGQQVLSPIFSKLEVLAARYAVQQSQLDAILGQIQALRRAMDETP